MIERWDIRFFTDINQSIADNFNELLSAIDSPSEIIYSYEKYWNAMSYMFKLSSTNEIIANLMVIEPLVEKYRNILDITDISRRYTAILIEKLPTYVIEYCEFPSKKQFLSNEEYNRLMEFDQLCGDQAAVEKHYVTDNIFADLFETPVDFCYKTERCQKATTPRNFSKEHIRNIAIKGLTSGKCYNFYFAELFKIKSIEEKELANALLMMCLRGGSDGKIKKSMIIPPAPCPFETSNSTPFDPENAIALRVTITTINQGSYIYDIRLAVKEIPDEPDIMVASKLTVNIDYCTHT